MDKRCDTTGLRLAGCISLAIMTDAITPSAGIERAFVKLDEGQLHLRLLPAVDGPSALANVAPLVLLHPSPASSFFMQPLMLALRDAGFAGAIIAPDTLGNGDSVQPAPNEPDITYFAGSMIRMLDALGLAEAHFYGSHTGARIACECGAAFAERTASVILDGITEYDAERKAQILAHYAPAVAPDEYGRHLIWAFNFVRDQALFFPHFDKAPANRLAVPMPPPDVLHRATLDVLKALGTYSKPYLAAFRYAAFERMADISAPTLILKSSGELATLNASVARAAELIASSRVEDVSHDPAAKAGTIARFLKELNT